MWLIYDWNHLIGLAKLNDIGTALKSMDRGPESPWLLWNS